MSQLSQDAKRLSLLFDHGVATADEVIRWADLQIEAMDSPPEALLALSTISPNRTADIISVLHELSRGAEFWTAFRAALGRIHDQVASHPHHAEQLAKQFYFTVVRFSPAEVPDDLRFLYRLDDAFSLAREGTYGEPESVHREFLRELERFKQAV